MHFSLMHLVQISTKTYIQVTVSVFFFSQDTISHLSTCSTFSHLLQSATFHKIFFLFLMFFFFPSFLRFFSFFYSFYIFFLHCQSLQSKLVQVTIPTLVYKSTVKVAEQHICLKTHKLHCAVP